MNIRERMNACQLFTVHHDDSANSAIRKHGDELGDTCSGRQ